MGSVYNRGTRKKPNYWIKWKEGGKWRYMGIGEDRRLAQAALRKIEGDVVARRVGLPDSEEIQRQRLLFRELIDGWVNKRKHTNRSWRKDVGIVKNHLNPFFGDYRMDEITVAPVKRFIDSKREELSPASIGHCIKLMGRFMTEMVEAGYASANPVRQLDRRTRQTIKSKHDPRKTPFLENKNDIRRVFLALPEPINVAFVVGVLAGLRTGEILALRWSDIDFQRRLIRVHRSLSGPPKSGEGREVPILDSLHPVLAAHKLRMGSTELLFPPHRARNARFMQPRTLHVHLKEVLDSLGLPSLTWYQATRHTFASQWMLDGRPIERLQRILGHSTVLVTERYAHLKPNAFDDRDRAAVALDLNEGAVENLTGGSSAH